MYKSNEIAYNTYPYRKIDVCVASRNQIKKKKSIGVNFTYAPLSSWGHHVTLNSIDYYYYPAKGDYLYLTIYEYDNGFWEELWGMNTASGYGIADYNGNFLTNLYIDTNENPYLVTALKIIPKGSIDNSVNTSNANIDNDQITFKSRHRN